MRKGSPKSPHRVIASRLLKEVGSLHEIEVSFGEPRPDSRGIWGCRRLIKGLGKPQSHIEKGGDSLQALLLAVEGARATLEKTGRVFTWFDETDPDKAGTGIPRYIPMFQGPRFEARVNLAIEREFKRNSQSLLRNRKANFSAFEAEVKERRELLAVQEETLAKLKLRADEWEENLKNWKPKIVRKVRS